MRTLAPLILAALFLGSCTTTPKPPDRKTDSAAASPANARDFGGETYRVISRGDEVVAVLDNGLVVITKRVASPVTAVRGYVMAGSVYEGKWMGGGLSHLLEHLIAGGTNGRRTEEQNRDLLQEIGNNSNAYTYFDRTAYFVNTTADNAEKAVDLVTGWMLTAKIPPDEYRREYEVVQRELEMYEGQGDDVFEELAQKNRYLVSPARVPIVGYKEVIQGLSRDDVYNYYKLAYVPNNMIFVVAGNDDPEKLLKLVRKHVKDVPPGRGFSHNIDPEPPVTAPRTIVSTFPKLGQAHVQLAFPSIRINNPDLYALDLVSGVLGGGESSILVEQIRDKLQLVTEISSSDPTPGFVEGTFTINFQTNPAKIDQATKAILAALEELKKTPIEPDRLKRAQAQIRAGTIFSRQTTENIADSLADGWMTLGDPHFQDRYVERIGKQTPADLQRVARKHLDTGRLITTVLLPEESAGGQGLARAQQFVAQAGAATAPATQAAGKVQRTVLEDGTVLLLKRMPATPAISINLYALGGVAAEEAETNGLSNLALALVPRGTKTRDAAAIARLLDSMGAVFNTTCGNNTFAWKSTCLPSDFPAMIELFADLVHNPTFGDSELDAARERILAAIQSQDSDWMALSMRFFKQCYFGPLKSPYQFTTLGAATTVKSFSAAQVRDWYAKRMLSTPRVLAIYGDIDPAKAKELAAKHFGGGAKRPAPQPQSPVEVRPATRPADEGVPAIEILRVQKQKTSNPQAGVVIGFVSDSVANDRDAAVLDVADCLASGFGFPTGYIFETLRGQGLVYDANAYNYPGASSKTPGCFIAYAGCDPDNVDKVIDGILLNIARLQGSPDDIQQQWFDRSKQLIVTGDAIANETPAAQAQVAAVDELTGLGEAHHEQFPARVRAVQIDAVRRLAAMRISKCIITVSTPQPDTVSAQPGRRKYEKFPPVDLTPRGVQHDSGSGGR